MSFAYTNEEMLHLALEEIIRNIGRLVMQLAIDEVESRGGEKLRTNVKVPSTGDKYLALESEWIEMKQAEASSIVCLLY